MWVKFADDYTETAKYATLATTATCATFAKVNEAKRVLEVACGPGKGAQMMADQFLPKGSALFATDISPKMIEIC